MNPNEPKPQHTPTPWVKDSFYGIVDANGQEIVFYTTDDDGINFVGGAKETILRAVNAHDEMLEALKASLWLIDEAVKAGVYQYDPCDVPGELQRRAIAKAEGKS